MTRTHEDHDALTTAAREVDQAARAIAQLRDAQDEAERVGARDAVMKYNLLAEQVKRGKFAQAYARLRQIMRERNMTQELALLARQFETPTTPARVRVRSAEQEYRAMTFPRASDFANPGEREGWY